MIPWAKGSMGEKTPSFRAQIRNPGKVILVKALRPYLTGMKGIKIKIWFEERSLMQYIKYGMWNLSEASVSEQGGTSIEVLSSVVQRFTSWIYSLSL
jgi:hypothetical protein